MVRELLTPAQDGRLRDEMDARGATGYVVSRDELFDDHLFVGLFAGRVSIGEVVIEGDDSEDDAIAAECSR